MITPERYQKALKKLGDAYREGRLPTRTYMMHARRLNELFMISTVREIVGRELPTYVPAVTPNRSEDEEVLLQAQDDLREEEERLRADDDGPRAQRWLDRRAKL